MVGSASPKLNPIANYKSYIIPKLNVDTTTD
jgi:hypothetical protein